MLGCGVATTSISTTKDATTPQTNIALPSNFPASNDPSISKPELDQIKNGMTFRQVAEIIGSVGEKVVAGTYEFKGNNSLEGKNVQLVFENDKVIMIIWGI